MTWMEDSAFFPLVLSLVAYGAGRILARHFPVAVMNPLLIAIALTILVLHVLGMSYDTYYEGAHLLHWLLTPATVCLAVPLYEERARLYAHWRAIGAGIAAGIGLTMACVLVLGRLLDLSPAGYATLLPKSITAAIGMDVSASLGGDMSITAAAIILTGILGNMFAPAWCRLFHLRSPIARGIAIGSASHAICTARAMEMGETEGAMSGLAMVVTGLLTVGVIPIAAAFFMN